MGNCLGAKKGAKVMRIDGQTIEFKIPVYAGEVVEEYPGHVLLDSEAVKNFGFRAKPLEPEQELQPRRHYFLVEPPKFPEERVPRRVRSSGIQMNAKDRLESLMLAHRRSVSDFSFMKSPESAVETRSEGGGVRLKLRLPKTEVEKLIMQSEHEGDAADKIMRLCMGYSSNAVLNKSAQARPPASTPGIMKKGLKSSKKRVGFGEIQQVAEA